MRKHGGFFVSDVATIAVSAPLKRQSTAALQNVAVIFALIFRLAFWSAAVLRRFPMQQVRFLTY